MSHFDRWGRPTHSERIALEAAEDRPAPSDPIRLGAMAERLLSDPVLKLALDRIDERLSATILSSAIGETDKREAAYRLHWAKEELLIELHGFLGNSRMIEAEMTRRDEEQKRADERKVLYG